MASNKTFKTVVKTSVLIYTFCSDSLPGSPQWLHLYDDYNQMRQGFQRSIITDEYDHSFVYLESKRHSHVLWKNKAGQVLLCGSGAYALAWMLAKNYKSTNIKITSEHAGLAANHENGSTVLELPVCFPTRLNQHGNRNLFVEKKSGIYLLELLGIDEINDEHLISSYRESLENAHANHIHGFCVFAWYQPVGALRYFTPWHGRDEDYVTGSIHQYLTPLIYKLYGVKQQKWRQYSKSPGEIVSVFSEKKVVLAGHCAKPSCPASFKSFQIE